MSKHLSPTQMNGYLKLGDVIIPGDREFPSFSQSGLFVYSDRIFDYVPKQDLEDLKLLFTLLAFLPKVAIRLMIAIIENDQYFPNVVASLLRMMSVGLKGLVFTPYYTVLNDPKGISQKIQDQLDWSTSINTSHLSPQQELDMKAEQIFSKAKEAQKAVSTLSVEQRVNVLHSVKKWILDHQEEIITQVQKEAKKSKSDILFSEIFGVLDHLDFLIKTSKKSLSDKKVKTPIALMGKSSKVYYEPLGTTLVISPWNYPFYQALVPITTSFVAGNATVYKPSEITPLEGLVEKCLEASSFPENSVQIAYGDGQIGQELIKQRPDKIFFTGSVGTGKKIMAQASENLIPVELELGGKDPMIVFDDVNVDRAVAGALWGGLTNAGQSCTSVEFLYVQKSIYEEFKNKLVTQAKKVVQKVDNDGDSDIGEMTSPQQILIVKDLLEDALAKGAKALTGEDWDRQSGKIPPIILEGITDEMRIYREEVFGPIIPILSFESEDEVIRRANDTDFGLSASVWSADLKRCDRVARALKTGNISINNVMLSEGNHYLPFGGVKDSGFGRIKGEFGLHGFSNVKAILVDKNSSTIEVNWYPYTSEKYRLFVGMCKGLFTGTIGSFIQFALTGMKLEGYANKVGKKGRGA